MGADSADHSDVGPTDGVLVTFLRAMAAAPDGDTVLRAAVDGMLRAYRASAAVLYLPAADGRSLRVAARAESIAAARYRYLEVPVDAHLPVTDVYRSGSERVIEVRRAIEEYPMLATWATHVSLPDSAEVAAFPLTNRSCPLGVLLLLFPDGVERSWRLRALLEGLTSALTIWIAGLVASDALASTPPAGTAVLRVTPRQEQVLAAVRQGRNNAEIAADLDVSVSTVKGDLAGLFRMLGATNRVELVDKAAVAGVLPPGTRPGDPPQRPSRSAGQGHDGDDADPVDVRP